MIYSLKSATQFLQKIENTKFSKNGCHLYVHIYGNFSLQV